MRFCHFKVYQTVPYSINLQVLRYLNQNLPKFCHEIEFNVLNVGYKKHFSVNDVMVNGVEVEFNVFVCTLTLCLPECNPLYCTTQLQKLQVRYK